MTSNQNSVSLANAELSSGIPAFNSPFAEVTRQTCSFRSVPSEALRSDDSRYATRTLVLRAKNPTADNWLRTTNRSTQFPTYSRLFPGIPIYSRIFGNQKEINSFSCNALPSCGHLFQKILNE